MGVSNTKESGLESLIADWLVKILYKTCEKQ